MKRLSRADVGRQMRLIQADPLLAPAVGVEPTLVALAASLDSEAFEVACEDPRRRRLTTITSLRSYLDQFLGREFDNSSRHKWPLSVAFADLPWMVLVILGLISPAALGV